MECLNCHQQKKIRAVGKCTACYVYEHEYGVPRPERIYSRHTITYTIFAEEWHHMTRKVGLPEQAAIYRLADAFKMEEKALERYAERYRAEQAVAA